MHVHQVTRGLRKRAERGLHLANISEETASVLAIANLQDVISMYHSVDDAISGS